MQRFKKLVSFFSIIGASLLVTGCGVNIETGPPTAEEKARSSEVRGKGVRSDWVNRFEVAVPFQQGMMFKTFVDSVGARYLDYGSTVAEQWRQGNEGRGVEVQDTEMREMIAGWTETEKPLLQSYDDVVEYAMTRIKETGNFDPSTEDTFQEMVDNYYLVYSAVFYPSGSLSDFEYRLAQLRTETEEISRRVQSAMQTYR